MKTYALFAFLLVSITGHAQQVDSTYQKINLRLNKAGHQLSGASNLIVAGAAVSVAGILLRAQGKDYGTVMSATGGLIGLIGFIRIGAAGRELSQSKISASDLYLER